MIKHLNKISIIQIKCKNNDILKVVQGVDAFVAKMSHDSIKSNSSSIINYPFFRVRYNILLQILL